MKRVRRKERARWDTWRVPPSRLPSTASCAFLPGPGVSAWRPISGGSLFPRVMFPSLRSRRHAKCRLVRRADELFPASTLFHAAVNFRGHDARCHALRPPRVLCEILETWKAYAARQLQEGIGVETRHASVSDLTLTRAVSQQRLVPKRQNPSTLACGHLESQPYKSVARLQASRQHLQSVDPPLFLERCPQEAYSSAQGLRQKYKLLGL